MTSTEDICFAIDWLESNDCPVESERLGSVADMLRSTIRKRRRAQVRRLVVQCADAKDPNTKHTPKGKAVIKTAVDELMNTIEGQEQS